MVGEGGVAAGRRPTGTEHRHQSQEGGGARNARRSVGLKTPPPGMRLAPLSEVARPQRSDHTVRRSAGDASRPSACPHWPGCRERLSTPQRSPSSLQLSQEEEKKLQEEEAAKVKSELDVLRHPVGALRDGAAPAVERAQLCGLCQGSDVRHPFIRKRRRRRRRGRKNLRRQSRRTGFLLSCSLLDVLPG